MDDQQGKARLRAHIRYGPDRRESANGNPYTTMKVAWPKKGPNAKGDNVCFVVCFGEAHEIAQGLKTGDVVDLIGELQVNPRKDDQSGKWYDKAEIKAERLEFVRESRSEADRGAEDEGRSEVPF